MPRSFSHSAEGEKTLRTVLIRRLGSLTAGALAVLGVGAITAQAASPVTQETVPVQTLFGASVVDPCSGQPITWTGNVHVIGVMTSDAAGGTVLIGHLTFEGVRGTDPTGAQYTVTWASNDSVVFAPSSPNLPTANVASQVIRINLISNGSMPNAYEDVVGHYTVTPAGQIAVSFERVGSGCTS